MAFRTTGEIQRKIEIFKKFDGLSPTEQRQMVDKMLEDALNEVPPGEKLPAWRAENLEDARMDLGEGNIRSALASLLLGDDEDDDL